MIGRCARLLSTAACLAATLVASGEARAFDPFLTENRAVRNGNELLAQGKAGEALAEYDKAAHALPSRHEVHLDRGLALMRMGDDKLDQAMQALKLASDSGAPIDVRARAHANLGNAFFKKQDYKAAVGEYQQSLMLAPGNADVAWNLELAAKKLKEQEDQKKKDEEKKKQDQEKQDQQKQDQQKQDQQKQDQQKQDQQKQDQQKQDQQKQDQEKQQQQAQPKTKQEIDQVLDSLDQQEDNLQKQEAKQRGMMMQRGDFKDW
ncbi:MAG: transglutaminase family protein [Deltaproteobacteria bacterium]|nr:transglutaminase family protein [Deltaproteobacteria bacterium]